MATRIFTENSKGLLSTQNVTTIRSRVCPWILTYILSNLTHYKLHDFIMYTCINFFKERNEISLPTYRCRSTLGRIHINLVCFLLSFVDFFILFLLVTQPVILEPSTKDYLFKIKCLGLILFVDHNVCSKVQD